MVDLKGYSRLGTEGLFVAGVVAVADAYVLPPAARFSVVGLVGKGAAVAAGLLLIDMYHKKMYPDGKHSGWGL